MKNIPVFDTENGVASLILKDIPYNQAAYIKIESTSVADAFMEECVSFCRVVGAERIFASGDDSLISYPLHASIIHMFCRRDSLQETGAKLIPVEESTLRNWLEIYRKKMGNVPNAAYMSEQDGNEMLRRGEGYFIYEEETLLGIGMASGSTIHLVASVFPNGGKRIVYALSSILSGDTVELDVAIENTKAVKLYESLGFQPTGDTKKWYKII